MSGRKVEVTVEYCPACRRDTRQERLYDDHERDSSNDHFECLECGAYYSGWAGEWKTRDGKEIPK